jgi:NADPH-dependent ferric siderophore reductase
MQAESLEPAFTGAPELRRVRYETRLRSLTVESVKQLTPGMRRILLTGEDLSDFSTASFDDHVKLLVPSADGIVERRDYTPRAFDRERRTLTLDFALHEAGPATRWALAARPGDRIQIAGPRGSTVISRSVRRWLLIGDETALPAIGRRIEEASAGEQITSLVAVARPAERQVFATKGRLTASWAYRSASAATDPTPLLALVRAVAIVPGTFVWVAAEAQVARALRTHLLDERAQPRGWMKAAGYWARGRADTGERIHDVIA